MPRLGDLLELNFGSHGQGGCSCNFEGLDRGLGFRVDRDDSGFGGWGFVGFWDSISVGTI